MALRKGRRRSAKGTFRSLAVRRPSVHQAGLIPGNTSDLSNMILGIKLRWKVIVHLRNEMTSNGRQMQAGRF